MKRKYWIVRRVEEEVELDSDDVLSIAEAADMMGMTVHAVAQALYRGAFTLVLRRAPRGKKRKRHRSLLRSEVEAEARRRAARAPLTGDDFLY